MKVFGSISRLVALIFRKDNNDVQLRPNQATTYTASRDIQLPAGDSDHVLLSAAGTATVTGKTIDGDDNTVQDLPLTSIKTVLADANKVIRRNSAGVPVSGSVTISDAGAVAAVTQLDVDNIRLDANTISSTNSNGNIILDPNGTGENQSSANLNVLDGAVLKLSDADSSAFIGHKSPAVVAASVTYQWPEAPGTSGFVLSSLTDGTLSWINNAATSSFTADWITADGTTKVVTHNLGTLNIQIEVFDKANGETINVDTQIRTNSNTLTLTSSEAPNASGWRVLITQL